MPGAIADYNKLDSIFEPALSVKWTTVEERGHLPCASLRAGRETNNALLRVRF